METINETANLEWVHRQLHRKAKEILQKHKTFLDTKPVRFLPAGMSGDGKKWNELKNYGREIIINRTNDELTITN